MTPPWTTDWINEEAKSKLKAYGIAPPAHKSTDKNALIGEHKEIICPRCDSLQTELISQFGSTACKAMYRCTSCLEPFEYFKCFWWFFDVFERFELFWTVVGWFGGCFWTF